MKLRVAIFVLTLGVVLQPASGSFFSDFQSAVSSLSHTFGKLVSDVIIDVKHTIDCTILTVEHTLAIKTNREAEYLRNCKSGNVDKSLENKPNKVAAPKTSVLKTDDIVIVTKKIVNITKAPQDPKSKLVNLKHLLATKNDRLGEVNILLKQKLATISEIMKNKYLKNFTSNDLNISVDNVYNEIIILGEVENNEKDNEERIKIDQVLNKVLDILDVKKEKVSNSKLEIKRIETSLLERGVVLTEEGSSSSYIDKNNSRKIGEVTNLYDNSTSWSNTKNHAPQSRKSAESASLTFNETTQKNLNAEAENKKPKPFKITEFTTTKIRQRNNTSGLPTNIEEPSTTTIESTKLTITVEAPTSILVKTKTSIEQSRNTTESTTNTTELITTNVKPTKSIKTKPATILEKPSTSTNEPEMIVEELTDKKESTTTEPTTTSSEQTNKMKEKNTATEELRIAIEPNTTINEQINTSTVSTLEPVISTIETIEPTNETMVSKNKLSKLTFAKTNSTTTTFEPITSTVGSTITTTEQTNDMPNSTTTKITKSTIIKAEETYKRKEPIITTTEPTSASEKETNTTTNLPFTDLATTTTDLSTNTEIPTTVELINSKSAATTEPVTSTTSSTKLLPTTTIPNDEDKFITETPTATSVSKTTSKAELRFNNTDHITTGFTIATTSEPPAIPEVINSQSTDSNQPTITEPITITTTELTTTTTQPMTITTFSTDLPTSINEITMVTNKTPSDTEISYAEPTSTTDSITTSEAELPFITTEQTTINDYTTATTTEPPTSIIEVLSKSELHISTTDTSSDIIEQPSAGTEPITITYNFEPFTTTETPTIATIEIPITTTKQSIMHISTTDALNSTKLPTSTTIPMSTNTTNLPTTTESISVTATGTITATHTNLFTTSITTTSTDIPTTDLPSITEPINNTIETIDTTNQLTTNFASPANTDSLTAITEPPITIKSLIYGTKSIISPTEIPTITNIIPNTSKLYTSTTETPFVATELLTSTIETPTINEPPNTTNETTSTTTEYRTTTTTIKPITTRELPPSATEPVATTSELTTTTTKPITTSTTDQPTTTYEPINNFPIMTKISDTKPLSPDFGKVFDVVTEDSKQQKAFYRRKNYVVQSRFKANLESLTTPVNFAKNDDSNTSTTEIHTVTNIKPYTSKLYTSTTETPFAATELPTSTIETPTTNEPPNTTSETSSTTTKYRTSTTEPITTSTTDQPTTTETLTTTETPTTTYEPININATIGPTSKETITTTESPAATTNLPAKSTTDELSTDTTDPLTSTETTSNKLDMDYSTFLTDEPFKITKKYKPIETFPITTKLSDTKPLSPDFGEVFDVVTEDSKQQKAFSRRKNYVVQSRFKANLESLEKPVNFTKNNESNTSSTYKSVTQENPSIRKVIRNLRVSNIGPKLRFNSTNSVKSITETKPFPLEGYRNVDSTLKLKLPKKSKLPIKLNPIRPTKPKKPEKKNSEESVPSEFYSLFGVANDASQNQKDTEDIQNIFKNQKNSAAMIDSVFNDRTVHPRM